MLPCLALLLLAGLSEGTSAGRGGEELALGAKARPWVTMTLEVPWQGGWDQGRQ